MTRFQLCSGSLIAQAASLRLDAIPNTYRKPRLVNSSRPPRALEVIGDLGRGIWAKRMVLSLPFCFLFILSWLANLCTPLPFDSATNKVVPQTFYFILFWKEIWSSLFRFKSTHCRRWRTPTPTYEDTGTFNHCKSAQAAWCKGQEPASVVRRAYKMCAYSNDDHSKMTTSSSVWSSEFNVMLQWVKVSNYPTRSYAEDLEDLNQICSKAFRSI